ncbi:peroxiredoxin family protein [Corallincola holothuriorum]|nr:TlpA disulfide reductase family protein [Corallincola holothuriorum]
MSHRRSVSHLFQRYFLFSMNTVVLLMGLAISTVQAAEAKVKAPDWALQTETGETIRLADFHGQPLILHFWATWCPYCKKVQPGLDALYQQYQEQGLAAVAISFREDDDATPGAVLKQRGISFKTAVQGEQVAALYGVRGTPTTLLIDSQGYLVYVTNTSDPNDVALITATKQLMKK